MKNKNEVNKLLVITAMAVAVLVSWPVAAKDKEDQRVADTIFTGGTVITMNNKQPQASAVAVRDGIITYVGSVDGVYAYRGETTRELDLQGRTLLPGFIDSHSHIAVDAMLHDFIDITPAPKGPVSSIADIQSRLRHADAKQGWLLAYGYDQSRLAEQRHPTRFDLDKVSTEIPIILVHVSMHIFVANSKALEMAGIDARTEDPSGGKFLRTPGSRELNGVMEELAAANRVLQHAPMPTAEKFSQNLLDVQRKYASYGVTTANEGAATYEQLSLLNQAAGKSGFLIDITALAYWHAIDRALKSGEYPVGRYQNRLKVAGVKFGVDGSLLASTAYLRSPYTQVPVGKPKSYRGYTQLSEAQIDRIFDDNYKRQIQIYGHVAGDAAADLFLQALERAKRKYGDRDHRSVMIHALMLEERQLDAISDNGVLPSFYAFHTCYWGDWYQQMSLGRERGSRVSPAKSAAERELNFTLHTDAPITPIDPLELLSCSVNRRTDKGTLIGAEQRISPQTALMALTINGAYQYYEEDLKGSIEVGKLADMVVLSQNPLTIEAGRIRTLRVLETFKEGATIYQCDKACSASISVGPEYVKQGMEN